MGGYESGSLNCYYAVCLFLRVKINTIYFVNNPRLYNGDNLVNIDSIYLPRSTHFIMMLSGGSFTSFRLSNMLFCSLLLYQLTSNTIRIFQLLLKDNNYDRQKYWLLSSNSHTYSRDNF